MQHGGNSDHAFRWEFAGGKIKAGETESDALVREIAEELGVLVVPEKRLEEIEYANPGKVIRLIPYLCRIANSDFSLNEHNDFMWLEPSEILEIDLLEADRKVLEITKNYSQLLYSCRENLQKGAQGSPPHDNG